MKRFLRCVLAVILTVVLIIPGSVDAEAKTRQIYKGKTIILHSNDVHGAIEGYTYIAGLKQFFKNRGAEVILVDAGDYSLGSTYVSAKKGADAISMMNVAGYDFATIGNHELDYGISRLNKNLSKADFTVLCANVFDSSYNALFQSKAVYKTTSGVKIGFFGLETPTITTSVNPVYVKNILCPGGEELYRLAQLQIDALSNADIVICLSHLGVDESTKPNTSYELYQNTTGIDFIIDGHSHTVMEKGENGEPIQSTGTKFENIGVVVIDNKTKKIERNFLAPVTELIPESDRVTAASDKIVKRVQKEYGAVFAKSLVNLNGEKAPGNRTEETNHGDLITDAMLWYAKNNVKGITVDADHMLAITNGGGIRAAVSKGDITKNDIFSVLPFSNTLNVVYLKGSDLLKVLETSTFCLPQALGGFPQAAGIKFSVDTTKKYRPLAEAYPGTTIFGPKSINRVKISEINGKTFEKKATYAIITNDFCANGGDTYYGFMSAERFDTGITLDSVVMEYIKQELGGVIGKKYSKPRGRISVITE